MTFSDDILVAPAPSPATTKMPSAKAGTSVLVEKTPWIETFLLVVAIIFYGKVWIWPVDVEIQVELYKPLGYVLRVALICVIPYTLYVGRFLIRPSVRSTNILLLLFILLCWLSLSWANQLFTSFQNCLDILCLFLTALLASQRMSLIMIQRTVFFTAFSVVLLSVLTSIAQLDFAIMGGVHQGRWRGLFGHKNNFAEFILFTSIIVMFIPQDRRVSGLLKAVFYALCMVSLAFAQSSTSLSLYFLAVFIRLFWPALVHLSRYKIALVFTLCTIGYGASTILLNLIAELLDSLGRDFTFTGRTFIWSYYLDVSMRTPFFGSGYGSFFTDEVITTEARRRLFAAIRSPHNGYLAVALGVGWIGTGLYSLWHGIVLWKSVTNQLGRFSGTVFSLAACYAIFSFFEVSGAGMISLGLLFLTLGSFASVRDVKVSRRQANGTLSPAGITG